MSIIIIIIFNFCSVKSCNILHKLNSFQNDLAENRTKPQSRTSGTISTSQGQTVQGFVSQPLLCYLLTQEMLPMLSLLLDTFSVQRRTDQRPTAQKHNNLTCWGGQV